MFLATRNGDEYTQNENYHAALCGPCIFDVILMNEHMCMYGNA